MLKNETFVSSVFFFTLKRSYLHVYTKIQNGLKSLEAELVCRVRFVSWLL